MISSVILSAICLMAAGDGGGGMAEGTQSIYDFTVKNVDGEDVKLSQYEGDVLVIVNVASK
jgi:glutathione peroxidase